MRSALSFLIGVTLFVPNSNAGLQQQNSNAAKSTNASIANGEPVLEDGTPVKLRIAQTVSSADAHVNDRVEFEVLEEVRVSDVLIIPKGGLAWGTVTEAEPKRRMARGGKLEIVMDSVRLADGEKAALRATKGAKGGGHTGAMTAGIVATGLIFWPAAPFFLFMHGKDITIPKGTEVPTFVDGNLPLELAKFQHGSSAVVASSAAVPPAAVPLEAATARPAAAPASASISSTPTGAEITIDDGFVGNAPSTVTLAAGKHHIAARKPGYETWERDVNVSGGSINISAELVASSTSPKPSEPAKKLTAPPQMTNSPNPVATPPPQNPSLAQLRSNSDQRSEVREGWIGLSVKDNSGDVVITSVERLSPAEKVELQVGDKILQLNGATVKSAREFEAAIAHSDPGSQLQIGYRRNYWMFTATVTVGAK